MFLLINFIVSVSAYRWDSTRLSTQVIISNTWVYHREWKRYGHLILIEKRFYKGWVGGGEKMSTTCWICLCSSFSWPSWAANFAWTRHFLYHAGYTEASIASWIKIRSTFSCKDFFFFFFFNILNIFEFFNNVFLLLHGTSILGRWAFDLLLLWCYMEINSIIGSFVALRKSGVWNSHSHSHDSLISLRIAKKKRIMIDFGLFRVILSESRIQKANYRWIMLHWFGSTSIIEVCLR